MGKKKKHVEYNQIKKISDHLGSPFAHLQAALSAAAKVDALRSSGTSFQILAILLVASIGYPGTGGRISVEKSDCTKVGSRFDIFSVMFPYPS